MRDFIRETQGEPVTFVKIEVTKEETLERNMPRVAKFCKEAGMTEEQAWAAWGCEARYGPLKGPEDWAKILCEDKLRKGMQNFTPDEKDTFVIDSGVKCAGTVPGLEKELGLTHVENVDIDTISELNYKRGGENMKQKAIKEAEWKTELEEKLNASAFLGGSEPNDEDRHNHMLLTANHGASTTFKYAEVTEESHPKIFAWAKIMSEK